MQTMTIEGEKDEGHDLNRYIVVAENAAIQLVCILVLNAGDERDCRDLTARWFLKTDHGVPTKCSIIHISDGIENINMTSNDDDVCEFLGIDAPEERHRKERSTHGEDTSPTTTEDGEPRAYSG